jgi:hypothetical protein
MCFLDVITFSFFFRHKSFFFLKKVLSPSVIRPSMNVHFAAHPSSAVTPAAN